MTGSRVPARCGRGGSSLVIWCRIASGFSPENGGRPSTAAYNVAPSAHASDAGVGVAPRATSGAR